MVRSKTRCGFKTRSVLTLQIHGTENTIDAHLFLHESEISSNSELGKGRELDLRSIRIPSAFMYWKNEVLAPLPEGNKFLSEGIPSKQVM